MFQIAAEKVAFIVQLLREFEIGRAARGTAREQVESFIADLNDEEQTDLVALTWIGRGTFEAEDYAEAVRTAVEERSSPTVEYLLAEPLLADYLESGMEAFGLDVTEIEAGLDRPV